MLVKLFDFWTLMQVTIAVSAVTSSEWAIWYDSKQVCVFKSSSVDFDCTYDYPTSHNIKTLKWIKPGPQLDQNIVVYHSKPEKVHASYKGRTELSSGNKNCTLRLLNVSESDVGQYLFRFKTHLSARTGEGGISLTLAGLPFRVAVNSSGTNGSIQEADKVKLTCKAENCTPSGVHVAWYKNGVHLFQVKSEALSFDSVSPSDFGNYTCGMNYSNSLAAAPGILLDVRYRPKNVSLTVCPTSTIQRGISLTLICHSYANPPVERYSLFKLNGTDVLQIKQGQNHTIPAVNPEDSGQYFCLAGNALGSQNSTVISVRVEDPERLLFVPAALGTILFGIIIAVVLFFIIKRKKQLSSFNTESTEKLPKAAYTPGLETSTATALEGGLDNLAVHYISKPVDTQMTYAELQFQPASSDRSSWTEQGDTSVVYSTVRLHGEHGVTHEPE